ncbi:hypothetical protein Taro_023764 [Colocasia esculenta]|uniref:Nuclear envelope integral membrane protein 1 n=1 Tax=Colocasia esculenta TaxID=4460 RepID=A0A843VBR6_COLES|nr:hypothetical protein [Colocasia esculenta]
MQLAAGPRRRPWLLLAFFFFFFIFSSVLPLIVSCDELAVTSAPKKLQLPPGQLVEGSPGSKPGAVMACNRILIRGVSRLRHLYRFFHSLKVKVDLVPVGSSSRVPTAEVCLHRNASIGVGMCPPGGWQKISKGTWVQTVSPFSDKILDIRMHSGQLATVVEVSTEEELFLPRVFFLIGGFILMAFAGLLSKSVVFYYGGAMTVGIILVILMVLFQGMKLLPTGRKSSLAIFMYSSILGVGTFILHYLSGLLRSALVELGIGEDIHKPLVIFFLLCLFLAGAWLGFWAVRKLVLDEEGVVDQSVAYAVEWSMLIFSGVMILQSSLDALLSTEALLLGISITSIMRSRRSLRFLRHLYSGSGWKPPQEAGCENQDIFQESLLFQGGLFHSLSKIVPHKDQVKPTLRAAKEMEKWITRFICRTQMKSSSSKYSPTDDPRWTPSSRSTSRKPFAVAPCDGTARGSHKTPPQVPLEGETFYSTFHDTPERKKFSKEEWKAFTRHCTKRAMDELSSSPDFARWVANNAERITVTPNSDNAETDQRFHWF